MTYKLYEKENLLIVLYEFLEYLPLKTYIRLISCQEWTYELYKSIILQIIDGIYYLHEHLVIHGDINLNNILICPIEKKLKIIDFGSAKQLSEGNNLYSPIGNPKYRPPSEEFFFEDAFKGECWSLGLIILSLVLKERVTTKLAMNFAGSIWERIEEMGINQNLVEMLKGLITEKAEERLNIYQVFELAGKV